METISVLHNSVCFLVGFSFISALIVTKFLGSIPARGTEFFSAALIRNVYHFLFRVFINPLQPCTVYKPLSKMHKTALISYHFLHTTFSFINLVGLGWSFRRLIYL